MLSILIPTYNYNIFPLVAALQKQAVEADLIYEIHCLDDGSSLFREENQAINRLPGCSYAVLPQNIGRSAARNRLGREAQFENLLFLDADVMPVSGSFLQNYTEKMTGDYDVIYGGIVYQSLKPPKAQLLRWVYGNEREALDVQKRAQNPHLSLLTLNFMIRKSVLITVPFNESMPNLRHEDTLFSYDLKKAGKRVLHIDNPVQHNGLESSEIFLKKSEEAVEGLHYLLANHLLPYDYTRISAFYHTLIKWRMRSIFAFFFKIAKKAIRSQLLSGSPSLYYFDLYRLAYLCALRK